MLSRSPSTTRGSPNPQKHQAPLRNTTSGLLPPRWTFDQVVQPNLHECHYNVGHLPQTGNRFETDSALDDPPRRRHGGNGLVRHHPTVFGPYLRCLLIDFAAVDYSCTGRWPAVDFQDGGPKPEVVFSCTILCRGRVLSTEMDCPRRVERRSVENAR